jgi:hypothetical protein
VVRQSAALAVFVALGFGSGKDPGCGGGDSPSGGENAPCTRTKDCKRGLVCEEGVCTEPDSGIAPVDAGGATPDAAAADGG